MGVLNGHSGKFNEFRVFNLIFKLSQPFAVLVGGHFSRMVLLLRVYGPQYVQRTECAVDARVSYQRNHLGMALFLLFTG